MTAIPPTIPPTIGPTFELELEDPEEPALGLAPLDVSAGTVIVVVVRLWEGTARSDTGGPRRRECAHFSARCANMAPRLGLRRRKRGLSDCEVRHETDEGLPCSSIRDAARRIIVVVREGPSGEVGVRPRPCPFDHTIPRVRISQCSGSEQQPRYHIPP